MKKIMKNVSKSLLAGMMVLAIAPRLVTTAFAEDNNTTTTTTTTTTTSTASPVTTTDTDPKDVTVDSDKLTVDTAGKQTEEKTSTVTTDGKADTDTVKDNNGNQANVVSGTDASTSTVTLDANGNPVDTKTTSTTTSDTASTTERTETGAVTTTTVTDTTVKTTETTTVDQAAIDAAGADANTANANNVIVTTTGSVNGISYRVYAVDADGKELADTTDPSFDHFVADFVIGTEAEGNQTIDLGKAFEAAINKNWIDYLKSYAKSNYKRRNFATAEECYQYLLKTYGETYTISPGDNNPFVVNVKTADGVKHTFSYENNSFVLNTGKTDTENYGGDSGANGYDGNDIPYSFVGAFASSEPIIALLGDSTGMAELVNKLNVYTTLASKGFTSEKYSEPLTAYILNYYNNKYNSSYTTFAELIEAKPEVITNMQGGTGVSSNNIYTVTKEQYESLKESYPEQFSKKYCVVKENSKGEEEIQLKWPEDDLAAMSYNHYYQDLFEFYYSSAENPDMTFSEWYKSSNSSKKDLFAYGLGDYANTNSELYQNVNSLLADQGDSISFTTYFGINGWYTNNSYQAYVAQYQNYFVLKQIDGSISVNKINTAGDAITDSQTGFNLYYISGDNANGQTMYYAVDEAGNAYFTADLTKAALLMTVDGNLSVQYLLPNTYYLKEVIAPEGYYLNKTALSVEVQSGKIAEVNFTDVAPITNTTTETETTVVKTVTTSILTTPIVPDTPKEPETPVVPSTPERPTTPTTEAKTTNTVSRPATPNTGDQTNANMFAGVMSISVLLAAAALALRKKLYK